MKYSAEDLKCLVPTSVKLAATGAGQLTERTFVVKDLVAIAGHVSSFGHPRWRETHEPAKETAPVIRNLLGSGATLVGVTKLDQLAYSLIGNVGEGDPPVNSLYPNRFTGGSSSGSASAVAGGLADFGIGTDTAGSIRIPAAACGIFGIRPTHGVLDTSGVQTLAESFDVLGLLAKSATLLRQAFEVTSQRLNTGHARLTRILLPKDVSIVANADVAQAMQATAKIIATSTGADISEVDIADLVSPAIGDVFARLQGREIWSNHSEWVTKNAAVLNEDVRTRLDRCRSWSEASEADKRADEETWKEYRQRIQELTGEGRILCLPVMPDLAPLCSSSAKELADFRIQAFRLTAPSSLSGSPQVVLPVRHLTSGKTLGIGILGPRDSDGLLLSVAADVAAVLEQGFVSETAT